LPKRKKLFLTKIIQGDTNNGDSNDSSGNANNKPTGGTGCGSTTINGGDGMMIGLAVAMIGVALIVRARRKRAN
jgi:uncharacterized protein (TIGR03382 family)